MHSPSPPAALSPGALIRGKYRVLRPIGEGAMGAVWAAFNEATSREVALKVLHRPDPDLRERLLREARACGAIQHRNIVDIYDSDKTENGDPFLVMPLLAGETVSALLKRKRRIEPPEAARIARDMARGLVAAHELGIIHRDLKPSNIFLHTEQGEDDYVVKILDFGVSKVLAGAQDFRTATGLLVGSPAYMSPEQVRARGEIDHRVDIWMLGVVLFEMLAGQRPIQGKPHELLMKVVHGDIPSVSQFVRQIDPALDAIVARCLQRDREHRPRSAREVAEALDQFVLPSGRLRGSTPELRRDAAPAAAAQPTRYDAAAAPAVPVEAGSGTVLMSPATPSSWRSPDEATTVPRAPAPREPMLGEHGTVKLSAEEAALHRPAHVAMPAAPRISPVPPPAPPPRAAVNHTPPAPAPAPAPRASAPRLPPVVLDAETVKMVHSGGASRLPGGRGGAVVLALFAVLVITAVCIGVGYAFVRA